MLRALMLFALLMASVLSVPVHAAPPETAGISKQQAINIAQQRRPGKVLSVKLKGDRYRVKTLSYSGEVRIVVIDASSGKVVSR